MWTRLLISEITLKPRAFQKEVIFATINLKSTLALRIVYPDPPP